MTSGRAAAARSKACSAFSTWVVSETLMKRGTERPTDLASSWAAWPLITPASGSAWPRRQHGEEDRPTCSARSELLSRPSRCSRSRMRRSMASREIIASNRQMEDESALYSQFGHPNARTCQRLKRMPMAMTTIAPVRELRGHRLRLLRELERKVLWLSAWTVHHANHLRPNRDGIKVGGHQASCASLATVMTALYFSVLRPEDRVAVKPHASPVFHAIQYLFGNQTRDKLERFRALGGAQSYPSRTKDIDDVDFSTGSVGLGVAMTLFASLVQDYVRLKNLGDGERPASQQKTGRMVALVGDAELDEGNIFEALLEGWKHD